MRIEAFSEGKNLDDPEANEDQLIVLPERGFAVIDGVTDRTGHRYDGQLAGRLAGSIVQRAVGAFLLDPTEADIRPERLVARVSEAIRAAYESHGILDVARRDPARRFGATLALAAVRGRTIRFVLVGDSGLRLDGDELWINDTGLDLVTASLRQEAYRAVGDAGGGAEERARVGRACAFFGAAAVHPDMRPWLDEAGLAALHQRCVERSRARFPQVPQADIERLLDGGIVGGQVHFQNNTASLLSYAVLDGFDVPLPLVRVIDRPRDSLGSIELFTDGYFKPGDGTALAAWEAAFAEVERDDPEKIDRYPSVKGTVGRLRADDRTVVIVRP
ncbi:MAG: protein phosphatase 2C domain-containing protein [Pseudomonadota bacterium]